MNARIGAAAAECRYRVGGQLAQGHFQLVLNCLP